MYVYMHRYIYTAALEVSHASHTYTTAHYMVTTLTIATFNECIVGKRSQQPHAGYVAVGRASRRIARVVHAIHAVAVTYRRKSGATMLCAAACHVSSANLECAWKIGWGQWTG